jgi:COP9 signalosome complex subunit 3
MMISIAQFLDATMAAGDSNERIATMLLPLLRTTPRNVLADKVSIGRDPLDICLPGSHTVAFLHLLVARLQTDQSADEIALLMGHVMRFSKEMNFVQAWMVPDAMRQFANELSSLSDRFAQPALPILPLLYCIMRNPALSSSGLTSHHHLTPLHGVFLKHCILAKVYSRALVVIDKDINEIEKSMFGLVYQDFLLYHYYGGLVYIVCITFRKFHSFLYA